MENPFSPPVPALQVLDILEKAGHEAYLVGGCVRDMLLSREPADWDVCTSAHPDAVKALFPGALDTGMRHGTITARMPAPAQSPGSRHLPIEITTFRSDSEYRDHRHPDTVRFCSDLATDLSRRDFTINAMAWNPHTGLVDLFGGRQDLSAQLVRCVGDPIHRFGEDALRMLRAIRFCSQLGFSLHHDALLAIRHKRVDILHVSAERISHEMTRTLTGRKPELASLWWETFLHALLFHPLHASAAVDTEECATIIQAIGRAAVIRIPAGSPDSLSESAAWARLLCAVCPCDPPEALRNWMRRLRFPNARSAGILKLVQLFRDPFPETQRNLRVSVSLHGRDWVDVSLQIRHALSGWDVAQIPLPDAFPLPGGSQVREQLQGGWQPESQEFGAFLECLRIARCEQPLFHPDGIPDWVLPAMQASVRQQKSGPVHSEE